MSELKMMKRETWEGKRVTTLLYIFIAVDILIVDLDSGVEYMIILS